MLSLVPFLLAYAVLAVVFGVLERLAPAIPRTAEPSSSPRKRRQELRTDLAYWVFTPVVTRAIGKAAVILMVSVLAVVFAHARDKAGIQAFVDRPTRLAAQPPALQLLELLFVADLFGYAVHRMFHGRRLWPFHAVHHSGERLNWLSSVRVHPVNEVVNKGVTILPLLFLGFDRTVALSVAPVLVFYAIFVHANLRWDFGPLRYVIATPVFHRWHHTSEAEGLDRNFAGFFPVIDLLFGTFYMPSDRQPQRFGVPGLDMPSGLLGQLAYPFRRRRPTLTSAQDEQRVAGHVRA
jgi:sterol desaturase/sphingolipid hydroxylase (fatty acid hydroxylase superfamily)